MFSLLANGFQMCFFDRTLFEFRLKSRLLSLALAIGVLKRGLSCHVLQLPLRIHGHCFKKFKVFSTWREMVNKDFINFESFCI